MRIVNFTAAAVLVTLTGYLFIAGGSILLPFVVSIFAAYLINALATASARIRIGGKPLPRTLRVLAAIALLSVLCWLGVSLVISNSNQLMNAAPVYEGNLRRLSLQASDWMGLDEPLPVDALFERGRLTGLLRSMALGMMAMIASLGAIAIYTVFLLIEGNAVGRKIAALFPDPEREALVHRILDRIGNEIQTYIWVKTILSAATTLLSYAIMRYVGLDLAGFWAVLIFFLNFIPYIGAWSGVVLPALVAIVQFDSVTTILGTIIGLTIVQFTGGSIIEPKVLGSGLNISPVVVVLSLAVWGTIWGIVGMFLAVPMMVVLMIICANFESTRPIAILLSADGQPRH